MHINFEEIPEKEVNEFNGGEGKIYIKTCLARGEKILLLRMPQGTSVGMHTHVDSSETEYIVAGTATFVIDGKEELVSAGECHYCPKGSTHTVRNDKVEELVIFAAVPELK